jgi:hypothetical protein
LRADTAKLVASGIPAGASEPLPGSTSSPPPATPAAPALDLARA